MGLNDSLEIELQQVISLAYWQNTDLFSPGALPDLEKNQNSQNGQADETQGKDSPIGSAEMSAAAVQQVGPAGNCGNLKKILYVENQAREGLHNDKGNNTTTQPAMPFSERGFVHS
jgi:hypothetical protein